MNSLLQAITNYTGIAIEYDYSVKELGKEDVHSAASFVPCAATTTEPSKTTEASTNTEPATLEFRIQSLEEQVKLLLARLAILEQSK